mmetsp:Transcript_26672/g.83455  ORF Transcript_26672/g.83455 Transcript_26672/m.83455 type:complete len:179 (+) Transcript_26672:179-715(+)|eukprot:CAMPEP_0118864678 /NCGR_PEP_ID=MMETSP1163-20130328/9177_1 /TAXON_ID=124430 /ORGANISM="Phaeomonas parva, Strain CCMP2877" /LENGTH=178 /DNA_ID=CAMNT_0006798825 /DNA_START=146 /DNA_END=682 /DNA_ORIENTATION=-
MARRLITAVALAAALQVCNGFLAPTARCSSRSSLALQAKKGFGKAEPPKKEKSKGQQLRDDAADNYQEMKDAGVPEYNVFIREAGLGDDKWVPAGVMAVPRNEKVDTAILANEDKLLGSILRQFPGLKNAVGYEFGYNRKIFPDDPIRMARPPPNDFVGNLLNQFLSPLNTDKMKKPE